MKRNSDEAVVQVIACWIRALVDQPEAVKVHAIRGTTVTILEVSVAPGDVKRVIGRSGRTADAIRKLLRAIGGRRGIRYELHILEPGAVSRATASGVSTERPDRVNAFENDPVQTTRELLRDAARELVDHEDSVGIDTIEGSQAAVFEVNVDQRDVSQLLGKGGATITALRSLIKNLGTKAGRPFILHVVDPIERVG